MSGDDLDLDADLRTGIDAVEANKPMDHHHHGGDGPIAVVREAEYRGHRIVVKTEYSLFVDDQPVTGHLTVGNDGQVHYHAMPNISFASAIDMVKQLIDAYPDEFPSPDDASHHDHIHDAGHHH